MSWYSKLFLRSKIAIKQKVSSMPTCTYCGGTEWYSGPSGGMSTNILCANKNCRHWFNYTPEPLSILDDLKRVEPTDEEKANEQAERRAKTDAEYAARWAEGRRAFSEGRMLSSLRTSKPYGGYAEASENIDRIAGFIDALADQIRGRPR